MESKMGRPAGVSLTMQGEKDALAKLLPAWLLNHIS